MDSSKKFVKPSPEDKANVLSRLFFCWTLPFFRFGYRNHLKIKDIYNTTKVDASGSLGDELESNWNKQIKYANQHDGARPSLQMAIFKTFYKRYSLMGLLLVLECLVIRLLQPIILAKYIRYYKDPPENRDENEGWALGTTVILLPFLHTILAHFSEMTLQRMGMRVRIACCSLIYRKLLKLSQNSLGQTAAGQLVNLLSNDVQRFDIAAIYLHYIWIMPLYFIFAYYVMYTSVGVAATSGMLTIAIQGIFLQGHLSRLQGYFRFKIALRTDHRIKLMSEITAGIQAIKLYAWEKPFQKIVELARKLEIDVITKTSYIKGISTGMMVFTERFILYLTLITYVLLGNNLTGDIIFSLAQLFNHVQNYVAFLFPNAVATYSEARVSIGRIEKFLLMEENTRKFEDDKVIQRTGSVELIHAKACWMADVLTLKNLNLTVNPGTLCCVVGSIGAGKSSLLQVLIQELPLKEGKVKIAGKVSYASQEPWLFVSSVRNNILFGREYNKDRYRGVVEACSLEADFDQFPYGDKTLVGERGAILSGGQKARISLARAVYSEADIYLFDDPLSAVDTHVARHLFEECIVRYLDGKTRVVVTHQLQFLKQADLVVVLDEGRIVEVGKFGELSTNRLKVLKEQSQVEPEDSNIKKIRKRTLSIISSASTINEDAAAEDDELIEKGAIPTSTYVEYCRAGTSLTVLFSLLFLLVVAQLASNACDFWLRHWANVEEIRQNESYEISVNLTDESEFITDEPIYDTEYSSADFEHQKLYIIVYTMFIIASIVLTSARSILYYKVCMNTSKALHNKMFACILQAPKRFFDVNPSGRILNRFSKDMGAIDELLPAAALDGIQIFLVLTGILMSVFIISPYMIIPAMVLGLVFHWCKTVYLSTSQDVKRLEGVTRAPVFSHTSATLQGLATIRSSRAEELLITEFDTLQDRHTSTWFLFLATSEAFGFYLDIICTIFLGLVTYQFMVFSGDSPSGNVGLVISQSLVLTGMLQYGVRQSAAVASNMVSVERVLQYTKLEKEESSGDFVRKVVLDGWPNYGRITFKSVNLRYVPDHLPVLKDLNIEIRPKEKIGIVGRTGAGKSSLIASLFRLAPLEGTITIDEVDTTTVHLQCLRSKISIIPQDPILFSASVRYNLDPFGDHPDEVLWKALENVELKSAIKDLNQEVSEGGANFSAGQKQLMCLARAIVRNNKILVMDEATANVDSVTDALIQKTIREKFKECTVMTIAHRLNTIMDSDRVLVMDYGQAVEFDHPHALLQKEDGHFAKMVKETGVNMQKILRNIAKDDHEKRYGTNL